MIIILTLYSHGCRAPSAVGELYSNTGIDASVLQAYYKFLNPASAYEVRRNRIFSILLVLVIILLVGIRILRMTYGNRRERLAGLLQILEPGQRLRGESKLYL